MDEQPLDNMSSVTEQDFFRARNKALLNGVKHFMNKDEATLLSFSEVKSMLNPGNEFYKGMQTVKVELIVGSEGRYQDFDNHFFPRNINLKRRWQSVDKAHLTDVILPPISLYELGGLYFVRDGNHRVSVARTQGIVYIDAEVTSLQSEIVLKPGQVQKKNLLPLVLHYEKRIFYADSNFGDITNFWDLDFSTPGQYDTVYAHIQTHKTFLEKDGKEMQMEDAIYVWYSMFYLPIVEFIEEEHFLKNFKGRTQSDLYVYLVKEWDYLKSQFGDDYSFEDAANTLKGKIDTEPKDTLLKKVNKKIRDIMSQE